MPNVVVVIGAGSIGQAIASRVSAGKHVLLAEGAARAGFALTDGDMDAIRALNTNTTTFFNHRDPEWVEKLSTRKLDI